MNIKYYPIIFRYFISPSAFLIFLSYKYQQQHQTANCCFCSVWASNKMYVFFLLMYDLHILSTCITYYMSHKRLYQVWYATENTVTWVWGPILTINYEFCLNKYIFWLLIVNKVFVKFMHGVELNRSSDATWTFTSCLNWNVCVRNHPIMKTFFFLNTQCFFCFF